MKNLIKTLSLSAVLFFSVTSCGGNLSGKQIGDNLKAAGYTCQTFEDEDDLSLLSLGLETSLVLLGIEDVPDFDITYAVMAAKLDSDGTAHGVEAYEFSASDQANFLLEHIEVLKEASTTGESFDYTVSGNCIIGRTDDSAKSATGL